MGKNTDSTSKKTPTGKAQVDFEPELDYSLPPVSEEDQRELDKLLEEINSLDEALSVSNRIKKRQTMRRYRSRMNIARKRALKRRATTNKITGRARKSAINQLKTRYGGGKSVSNMSYAERARVEKMVSKRRSLVNRNTRRLVRVKRALDRNRRG